MGTLHALKRNSRKRKSSHLSRTVTWDRAEIGRVLSDYVSIPTDRKMRRERFLQTHFDKFRDVGIMEIRSFLDRMMQYKEHQTFTAEYVPVNDSDSSSTRITRSRTGTKRRVSY